MHWLRLAALFAAVAPLSLPPSALTNAAPAPPIPAAPGSASTTAGQFKLAVNQTAVLPDAYAGQMAYSPDGQHWIASEQRSIGVYQGLKRIRQIEGVWVDSSDLLSFSADGKRILSGGRIYNFADGKQTFAPSGESLSQHAEEGWGVAAAVLTPDERQCLAWLKFYPSTCCLETGHRDSPTFKPASPVFVIDPATGSSVPLPLEPRAMGEYQALAASNRLLVASGVVDKTTVFDRKTMSPVATLDVRGAWYGFRFSADGRMLVGIHLGRELVVYDTEHFTRLARFEVLSAGNWISALAVHPKLPVVAVSGWDRVLRLYSLARGDEGRLLYRIELGQASALTFSLAGDELLAAVSGPNRIVRLSVKVE